MDFLSFEFEITDGRMFVLTLTLELRMRCSTLVELHARLVYAEAVLIRAILTFTQDQGLIGFISGGLKMRECNDIFT